MISLYLEGPTAVFGVGFMAGAVAMGVATWVVWRLLRGHDA